MPARSTIRVVAPEGRPETQIWSPSRVTAAPCTGGSSRTQSSAWKSSRRAGATVKSMQARGGSASGSVATRRIRMPVARRASSSFCTIVLLSGARSAAASNAWIACAGRFRACNASAINRSAGTSGAPLSAAVKFCQAACKARLASGGVRRICASASASHCAAVASPCAMRVSHAAAAAAQSCLRIAAAAACSACLRACGVPPAGKRDVRVRSYAALSASRPGRVKLSAHATRQMRHSNAASSSPSRRMTPLPLIGWQSNPPKTGAAEKSG